MRSKVIKLTLILLILVGAFLLVNSRADNEGPKVGIAIKTVDESGNPVEGVTFNVNYLGEDIEVGPSGSDGYAKSDNDAIQLFNTPGTAWQEEGITETTFGGNDLNLTAVTYPDQYEVLIPEQKHNNDYIDNIERLTDNKIEINGSTWGGAISNRPTKETERGTFLDANDVFEEGEYFEYVHMLGKVEGSGMPMESIHLSFVAKESEEPVNPDDPDPEQPVTQYGALKIKKYKEGTIEPLAGAVYEVYFKNEEYYDTITLENGQTKYGWEVVTTLTTGDNGEVSTGMILPKNTDNGNVAKYYIKEITAPVGYELDNTNQDQTYLIIPGEQTEIIRYNREKEYGEIKIIKHRVGDESQLLPGAEFQIINDSNKTITLKNGTLISPNGVAITITTDENGEARTGMILPEDGQYRINETKSPDGYEENRSTQSCSVERNIIVSSEETNIISCHNFIDRQSIVILKDISPIFLDELNEEDLNIEFPIEITLRDENGDLVNDEFHYYLYNNNEDYCFFYRSLVPMIEDMDIIRFENGKAVTNLKIWQGIIVIDIPKEYTYEISEREVDDWYVENTAISGIYHQFGAVPMNTIFYQSELPEVPFSTYQSNGIINCYYNNGIYFFNSKSPQAIINISGKKVQTGRKLQKDDYSFEIKDSNNNVVGYAAIDENGKITFDNLKINSNMLNRRNINYASATEEEKQTIKTWVSNFAGIGSSIVTDIIPPNAYYYDYEKGQTTYYKDATEAEKKTVKYWRYNDKNDYVHAFFNINIEGILDYASSDIDPWGDGSISPFNAIEFSGDLEYTISEVLPEGVTKENPTKDGVTYDTHEEKIKIHAHGYHGEDLKATIETDEDGIVFVNKYNKKEEKIEFEVDAKPVKETPKKDNKKEVKRLNNPFTGNNGIMLYTLTLILSLLIIINYKYFRKSL